MKLLLGIACIALLATFVNSEVDTKLGGNQARDDSVDNYITLVLINFSEVMRTGDPYLGIPVLDPFTIDYLQVEGFNSHHLKLDANASNIVMKDYSYYIPTYVHVAFGGLTMFMNLDIAEINSNGTYWCDGMYQFVFPVFGAGPFSMQVYQSVSESVGSVYITQDGYLQISYLNMTVVFEQLVIYLENFLGGGDFGDQVNNALSVMGKLLFEVMMPKLGEVIIPTFVNYLNAALMQHTINEIILGALPSPPGGGGFEK